MTPEMRCMMWFAMCAQGTKACLGWEREPQGGTYACTAVTDAWLGLLQAAFAAARLLPKQAGTPAGSRRATAEMDARVGTAAVSYAAALQELLTQLLQHWKVCWSLSLSLPLPV
jgi:hypothetical protein